MTSKIRKAREMLNKKDSNFDQDEYVKLKDITDRSELLYNDIKIKLIKSMNAEYMLKVLEKELDRILEIPDKKRKKTI